MRGTKSNNSINNITIKNKIINLLYSKIFWTKLILVFITGFIVRYLISTTLDVDVVKDILNWISLSYYGFMAFFSLLLSTLFTEEACVEHINVAKPTGPATVLTMDAGNSLGSDGNTGSSSGSRANTSNTSGSVTNIGSTSGSSANTGNTPGSDDMIGGRWAGGETGGPVVLPRVDNRYRVPNMPPAINHTALGGKLYPGTTFGPMMFWFDKSDPSVGDRIYTGTPDDKTFIKNVGLTLEWHHKYNGLNKLNNRIFSYRYEKFFLEYLQLEHPEIYAKLHKQNGQHNWRDVAVNKCLIDKLKKSSDE